MEEKSTVCCDAEINSIERRAGALIIISHLCEHTLSASLLLCVGALTVHLWVRGFSCTRTKQATRFIKSCIRRIRKQHSKQNVMFMFIVLWVFHLGGDSGTNEQALPDL